MSAARLPRRVCSPAFNLSILECKFAKRRKCRYNRAQLLISPYWNVNCTAWLSGRTRQHLLISPYWNVNESIRKRNNCEYSLLISPYWNVNRNRRGSLCVRRWLLISPYWNVNKMATASNAKSNWPFNLSILECKFRIQHITFFVIITFNLSILECKWFMEGGVYEHQRLLISPYWNVNRDCIIIWAVSASLLISPYWNVNYENYNA